MEEQSWAHQSAGLNDGPGNLFLPVRRNGLGSFALRGIVTGPRSHNIVFAFLVIGELNLDPPECSVFLCVRRVIAECVLVADFTSDGHASRLNLIKRPGEVSLSAGGLSQLFQNLFVTLVTAPVDLEQSPGMLLTQQADAINHGV